MIKVDMVEIEGRTLEGVKFLGMIPEAIESEDFNVYVRWDGSKVSADRSDTDRQLVAAHVTKTVGKVEALRDLFTRLATLYGVAVTVQADPGVRVSALASKVLGTYGPRDMTPVKAITSADVDAQVRPWIDNSCPKGGQHEPNYRYPMSSHSGVTVGTCACGIKVSQADFHSRDYVTEAEMISIGAGNHCSNGRCAWCQACLLAQARHKVADPFGTKVTVGGFDNAGTDAFPVAVSAERAELASLPIRTPGASLDNLSDFDPWHGTNTCVNCGCDPQVPVYTLNRGFRFPMGKRARKQVKRAKRTRVGV